MHKDKVKQILIFFGTMAVVTIFQELVQRNREIREERQRENEVRVKIYGELNRALDQFMEDTSNRENRTKLEFLLGNIPPWPRPGILDLYTKTSALEVLALTKKR